MDLRRVAYFVAVAEELSFVRAAKRLHLAPSALSQQVRKLEAELGAPLLARSTRWVGLTAAGERFLPEARAVLSAARRAEAVVRVGGAEQMVDLRLGASPGLGARLSRLVARLTTAHPGARLDVVRLPDVEASQRVARGDVDLAVSRGASTTSAVRLHPLWQEPLAAAIPAPHARGSSGEARIRLSRLQGLTLAVSQRDADAGLLATALTGCLRAGFRPRVAVAAGNRDVLAMVAVGRRAWTVIEASRASTVGLLAPGIRLGLTDDPLMAIETSIVAPGDRDVPMLAAVLDAGRSVDVAARADGR